VANTQGPWLCLLAAFSLALARGPATTARTAVQLAPAKNAVAGTLEFSDWHLPLPAGDWLISRGPCGGAGLFTHQCGYYEDECAIDLTPLSGSMLSVPVLAPQAGRVFFMGTRTDTGLALLLEHDDGRVSALMHLSKVVVGIDQRVTQGQVIGYAGNTGSSTRPHLHFDIQPNAVERACLPLTGLDGYNPSQTVVKSHNLAWSELVLADPPLVLPAWLPLASGGASAGVLFPALVVLAPGAQANIPVAVANNVLGGQSVYYSGHELSATLTTDTYTLFSLPLTAPRQAGDYQGQLEFRVAGVCAGGPPVSFDYAVQEPVDVSAGAGLVFINPIVVGPANGSLFSKSPRLCVSEPAVAGQAPLSFRVMLAGAGQADSGWIADDCWTPPPLGTGTYFWKVFVRDARGYMNRTYVRPTVFKIQ
jgi:hypothetical protein